MLSRGTLFYAARQFVALEEGLPFERSDGASISRFTGTHRRLFLFVAALIVFMYEQILDG